MPRRVITDNRVIDYLLHEIQTDRVYIVYTNADREFIELDELSNRLLVLKNISVSVVTDVINKGRTYIKYQNGGAVQTLINTSDPIKFWVQEFDAPYFPSAELYPHGAFIGQKGGAYSCLAQNGRSDTVEKATVKKDTSFALVWGRNHAQDTDGYRLTYLEKGKILGIDDQFLHSVAANVTFNVPSAFASFDELLVSKFWAGLFMFQMNNLPMGTDQQLTVLNDSLDSIIAMNTDRFLIKDNTYALNGGFINATCKLPAKTNNFTLDYSLEIKSGNLAYSAVAGSSVDIITVPPVLVKPDPLDSTTWYWIVTMKIGIMSDVDTIINWLPQGAWFGGLPVPNSPAPCPVDWSYQLQNGSWGGLLIKDSDNTTLAQTTTHSLAQSGNFETVKTLTCTCTAETAGAPAYLKVLDVTANVILYEGSNADTNTFSFTPVDGKHYAVVAKS